MVALRPCPELPGRDQRRRQAHVSGHAEGRSQLGIVRSEILRRSRWLRLSGSRSAVFQACPRRSSRRSPRAPSSARVPAPALPSTASFQLLCARRTPMPPLNAGVLRVKKGGPGQAEARWDRERQWSGSECADSWRGSSGISGRTIVIAHLPKTTRPDHKPLGSKVTPARRDKSRSDYIRTQVIRMLFTRQGPPGGTQGPSTGPARFRRHSVASATAAREE